MTAIVLLAVGLLAGVISRPASMVPAPVITENFAAGLYVYDVSAQLSLPRQPALVSMMTRGPGVGLDIGDVFVARIAPEALTPELRALSEANLTDTGTTVLGRFPGYIAKAQDRGASYFDIGDAWNAETGPIANQHFLDTIASRGDQVLLSIPKQQIQAGTTLEGEIQVLTQNWGYRWINQWALRPGA